MDEYCPIINIIIIIFIIRKECMLDNDNDYANFCSLEGWPVDSLLQNTFKGGVMNSKLFITILALLVQVPLPSQQEANDFVPWYWIKHWVAKMPCGTPIPYKSIVW